MSRPEPEPDDEPWIIGDAVQAYDAAMAAIRGKAARKVKKQAPQKKRGLNGFRLDPHTRAFREKKTLDAISAINATGTTR